VGPRARFPISREDYTFGALFRVAVEAWRERWGRLALVSLLFFMVVYAPALLLERALSTPEDPREFVTMAPRTLLAFGVTQLLTFVLDTAATLVMTGYILDLLERKPGTLATRLARLRALPAQLGALILIYLAVAALLGVGYVIFQLSGGMDALPRSAFITGGIALGAVPLAVYASLGLVFLSFELAHAPEQGTLSALSAAWELVADQRGKVALLLTLNTLLTLMGLPTCLIGVLFTFPLGMLCTGGLYLALKQPR
jgi:hypothetical protein